MDAKQIWEEALKAGADAGKNATPTPMTVGSTKSIFSNEIDYSKPTYHVSEGVCGFAWVTITPARGKMVQYLKSINEGGKGYYGGYQVWVHLDTQSLERKTAAACAMAGVFQKYGIECHIESRMD